MNVLRLATEKDWTRIEKMRADFFSGLSTRKICKQKCLFDCVWVVAADSKTDEMQACVSYDIDNDNAVLYMHDFFLVTKRAGYNLMRFVHKFADDNGFTIMGDTPLENVNYREILRALGYRETGVRFQRMAT